MIAGMLAPYPEDRPVDHRVGHTGLLARLRDEVHEDLHDDDADQQRDQHLPAGDAEREQAACGEVAADGVHIDIQNAKMLYELQFCLCSGARSSFVSAGS
jgi:hypothetical protein